MNAAPSLRFCNRGRDDVRNEAAGHCCLQWRNKSATCFN
eukprot:XP_001705190.1 Hypothetical protein GL50803_38700 [Giardia lamblia ATCC 50803]